MKGNKGEWSEVYVFLKLLGDGKLQIGNANHEKLGDYVYPILSIIREEIKGNPIKYNRDEVYVSLVANKEEDVLRIPTNLFKEKAGELFGEIKRMTSVQSFPEIESFLNQARYVKIKASSSRKSDIEIIIYDSKLGLTPQLGFSIKSMLGSPATLLNASKATNIQYQLAPCLDKYSISQVNLIEGTSKVRKRLSYLSEREIMLRFHSIPNKTFNHNLMLVDSCMPEIVGHILKYYYEGKGNKITTLVSTLEKENPLQYDVIEPSFYEYKIKKLLVEIALGMTPAKQWNGVYDATGGYIVVKQNGDLLCYHVYNRNLFEEYLFRNTQLDTPSTSRHDFGYVLDGNFINLNLQIRFL